MDWKYALFWFIGFIVGGTVVQEIYIQIHKNDKTCDSKDIAIAVMYLCKMKVKLEKEFRTSYDEDNWALPYDVEAIKRVIEYLK